MTADAGGAEPATDQVATEFADKIFAAVDDSTCAGFAVVDVLPIEGFALLPLLPSWLTRSLGTFGHDQIGPPILSQS